MSRRNKKTKVERATGRRINSADVMIVLLFIVCIVGMVLRFGLMEKIEQRAADQTVTVSFVIEGVSSTSADYISVGDEVYFSENDAKVGKIVSINDPEPSVIYYHGEEGSIVSYQSVDGKINLKGSMTMKGSMTDAGFMLDGTTYIAPNMTLWVKTQNITVSMLVTSVEVAQ